MKVAICNCCGRMTDRSNWKVCYWCGKDLRSYRDVDREDQNLTQDELTELWLMFGDVPINDRDEIQEEFIGFDAGTNRFDIWQWFDQRYESGVAQLIHDAEKLFRELAREVDP